MTGRGAAELEKAVAEVQQQAGQIDVLFANAGGGHFAPLGAITEEQYDRIFGSNVKGPMHWHRPRTSTRP